MLEGKSSDLKQSIFDKKIIIKLTIACEWTLRMSWPWKERYSKSWIFFSLRDSMAVQVLKFRHV